MLLPLSAPAANTGIHKNSSCSNKGTPTMYKEETNKIIKIIKSLIDYGLLIIQFFKITENESNKEIE